MKIKNTLPLILVSMLLGSCSGVTSIDSKDSGNTSIESNESTESKSDESIDSTTSTTSTQPKPTKVEIDFWHTFGQGIEGGISPYVEKFQQLVKRNEGVDVTINLSKEGAYSDIHTKIINGFGAGNVPTIAVAYPDHVADYLEIKKEYVQDLDVYINNDEVGFGKEAYLGDISGNTVYGEDDFISVFLDEGKNYNYSGTYSIPFMKSTEVMFYNLNMIRRALRIHKPQIAGNDLRIKEYMNSLTWNELFELASIIKTHKSDVAPRMEYPVFYDSDGNLFISQLYQRGIGYSSYDNNRKPVIDFERQSEFNKVVSFLDELRYLHSEGLLTTKGTYGQYSSYSFADEKCAFAIGSSGGAGYNDPQSDAFELGVAPVPYTNERKFVTQGVTLTILRNPKYSNEENDAKCLYAWKFIKYLTNPDNDAGLCIEDSQGYVPVRESAYESDEYIEFLNDDESVFNLTAKVVMEINSEGENAYINTPVFKGSAYLREQCGSAIARLLKADETGEVITTTGVLNDVISNSKAHF